MTATRDLTSESKFWDRLAKRYAKKPIADVAAYRRKLDVTRRYFAPSMNVLEFGCGTGSTAIVHAPYVRHIHAIDISAKMIDIAKAKAHARDVDNVTFTQATLEDLASHTERYDAILGMSILHLLDDKDEALAAVHRLLKPGGVFVSTTPCIGDTMKIFKIIGPVGAFLGLLPKLAVFTTEELVTSVTNTGFTIDHRWQPAEGKALFVVAKKAGSPPMSM